MPRITISAVPRTVRLLRTGGFVGTVLAAGLILGPVTPIAGPAPALAEDQGAARALPAPPANGVMGFLIAEFVATGGRDKNVCPNGRVQNLRETYLESLDPAERTRLSLKENEPELTRKWQATAFGPNGENICSQPDMFDRPLRPTVQGGSATGLDLDNGDKSEGCAQREFVSPTGETGIDNQVYRAMGCSGAVGTDSGADEVVSGLQQFFASGQWTQVLLLRGVDSLENDDDVEVIYANTADAPQVDSKGKFLPGSSFTIDDKPPRNRNVLRGRIRDGVLTTEPQDIKLVSTWGQGGAREIRGHRTKFDYRKGRLRLTFQPDGSLTGLLGGYRPAFDLIAAPALGGAGSAVTAGIDCASMLKTALAMADGVKDPKTGKCTALSSAQRIRAIPAFVNDAPPARTAAR